MFDLKKSAENDFVVRAVDVSAVGADDPAVDGERRMRQDLCCGEFNAGRGTGTDRLPEREFAEADAGGSEGKAEKRDT